MTPLKYSLTPVSLLFLFSLFCFSPFPLVLFLISIFPYSTNPSSFLFLSSSILLAFLSAPLVDEASLSGLITATVSLHKKAEKEKETLLTFANPTGIPKTLTKCLLRLTALGTSSSRGGRRWMVIKRKSR